VVDPPGEAVTVQDPEPGRSLNATLPVEVEHVGCVMVPTVGADGVTGAEFMVALEDAVEVQPDEFVTVKV
jgi:hypothetical protein